MTARVRVLRILLKQRKSNKNNLFCKTHYNFHIRNYRSMSTKNIFNDYKLSNKENFPNFSEIQAQSPIWYEKRFQEPLLKSKLSDSTRMETVVNLGDLESNFDDQEEERQQQLCKSHIIAMDLNDQEIKSQKELNNCSISGQSDFCELSNYQILQKIGSGEFGEVFRTNFKPLNLQLAIKIIKVANFDQQYQQYISSLLSNEKIVCEKLSKHSHLKYLPKTYAVFENNSDVYIVTELFYGFTLSNLLSYPEISLTPPQIKYYLSALLLAIKELHQELSSIHRDIKPENIMILANGSLKLIDFGCSKELMPNIKTSSVIGTYQYFSPQRFLLQYGKQADIWAFVVVAYQIVFKELPFRFVGIGECEEDEKLIRLSKIVKKRKNFKIQQQQLIDPELKFIIQGIFNATKEERQAQWTIQKILGCPYFKNYIESQPLKNQLQPIRTFSCTEIDLINSWQQPI